LTTIYDDKILNLTSNWRATNDIVRKVGGDKSAIIQAVKRLLEIGYLETKPDTNKVLYKRMDTVQSEFNFIEMMAIFEKNQKTELNVIKQIPTIMMSDGVRFRKKGLELLEHIQEEVNSLQNSKRKKGKTRQIYRKNYVYHFEQIPRAEN
jgi:hypothetical protein